MASRRTSRNSRRVSRKGRGTLVTKKQAFGSMVVILAGIAAVIGMGAYSFDQQQSSSLVGQAGYQQSVGLTCFTSCINNCDKMADVSKCLDDTINVCRSMCSV